MVAFVVQDMYLLCSFTVSITTYRTRDYQLLQFFPAGYWKKCLAYTISNDPVSCSPFSPMIYTQLAQASSTAHSVFYDLQLTHQLWLIFEHFDWDIYPSSDYIQVKLLPYTLHRYALKTVKKASIWMLKIAFWLHCQAQFKALGLCLKSSTVLEHST